MKHNFLKKLTAFLLVTVMLVTLIPALPAFAADSVTLSFEGGNSTNQDPISFTKDDVSAVFTAGTHNTKPRWDSTCVRFYGTSSATNNLTITASGETITEIKFTMNDSYDLSKVSVDSGTINTTTFTWTGSATSVVFTTTAQTRFNGVTVTYGAAAPGGHEHAYAWDGIQGANGKHTVVCANTDGQCNALSKEVDCSWDEGRETTFAECDTKGVMTFTCVDCLGTKEEDIPMLPHNFVGGVCTECNTPLPLTHTFDYTTGTNSVAPADVTGPVNIDFDKGEGNNDPKWYTSGTAIRFYNKNTVTISALDGYRITKVTFNFTTEIAFKADSGSITNGVWTPDNNVETVIFTNTSTDQVRVSEIVVELAENVDCLHPTWDENCVCTTPGCGEVLHDMLATPSETTPVTCTTPGTEVTKCSRFDSCGHSETKYIPAVGHNYVDGVCSVCSSTEITALTPGQTIYFVGKITGMQHELTGIEGDVGTAGALVGGDYWFEVKAGATAGTVAFSVKGTNTYLSFSGGSENKIHLSNVIDANSSWTVTANAAGGLDIVNSAITTRKFCYNDYNARFCCYEGGQNPVYAYAYDAQIEAFNWNLNLKDTISVNVNYFIPAAWIAANPGAKVKFIHNSSGQTIVTIDAVAGLHTYTASLNPAHMVGGVTVVILDANGNPVEATRKNVGVDPYFDAVCTPGAVAADFGLSDGKFAALHSLVIRIWEYGRAINGFETISGDFSNVTGVLTPDDANDIFNSASAVLADTASMKIKLNVNNLPANCTLTVDLGGNKLVDNKPIEDYITSSEEIVIKGIYTADYGKTITVTINDGSADVATTSFTFNHYLKALYEAETDANVKDVILGAYMYGVALAAYLAA